MNEWIGEIIFWINVIPMGILTIMVTHYFATRNDKEKNDPET